MTTLRMTSPWRVSPCPIRSPLERTSTAVEEMTEERLLDLLVAVRAGVSA